jgi:hypothetical protein
MPTELREWIQQCPLNLRREPVKIALGVVQERELLLPGREGLGRLRSTPPFSPFRTTSLDFRKRAALVRAFPSLELPNRFGGEPVFERGDQELVPVLARWLGSL